jgi:hypothetical protein
MLAAMNWINCSPGKIRKSELSKNASDLLAFFCRQMQSTVYLSSENTVLILE